MLNRSRLRPTGQPVEEPIDRLRSFDRGPIEVVRSRIGQGLVEATVTCHALNAPTASEPVDP